MKAAIAALTVSLSLLATTFALAQSGRIPTQIKLKLGPAVGLFKGKVTADLDGCVSDRKVIIVRASGQDVRVGKGYTNAKGHYKIQTTESSGDWYAKTKHSSISGGECKGARSKIRSAG